ncbi:MAG TPA: PilN domain-containing protein [Candidatus Methylomirabilis sp.]|nr:PilN domain-containing protein [Candidatus Methylomirabilis sp.]
MKFFSFLKKIFVPEEPIAGLEITDAHLRLVLLGLNKKDGAITTRESVERALEPGIIVNGEIKDKNKLSRALWEFKKGLKVSTDYVIASIPADKIYLKILSFPKNIEGERLDEAVRLAIDFQLPHAANDSYYSWEVFPSDGAQKVFVAEALKKDIDPYLECVRRVFRLIALEFQGTSFARVVASEKDKVVLLKITNQSSFSFFIIKNNVIRFSRTLSASYAKKKIDQELEKISDFYESAAGEKISEIIDLTKKSPSIDKKINFPLADDGSWLMALGAARRGIIPRQLDDFVSLSPISAQKAYKYHKAVSFASILTWLIVGLAIFFIVAFASVWLLMITLQQQTAQKAESISSLSAAPDLQAVEQKIQDANSLISATAEILGHSPRWSLLIEELQKTIIDGIVITGLNLPAADATLSLNGVAQDRVTLNKFRDNLKSSTMLTDVKLPLTNLEQKENIPFSISFNLKNPSGIYFK